MVVNFSQLGKQAGKKSKSTFFNTQKAWDLSYLYFDKSKSNVYNNLLKIEKMVKQCRNYSKKLPNISIIDFRKILKIIEKITIAERRLYMFLDLRCIANRLDQEAISLKLKCDEEFAKFDNDLNFFYSWFNGISNLEADKYVKAMPEYSYYLNRLRELNNFILSDKEEKILNLFNPILNNSTVGLYDLITSKFSYEINGKQLSRQEISSLYFSLDSSLRNKVYDELFKNFEQNKIILTEIYKNLVLGRITKEIQLRGYPNSLVCNAFSQDIDPAIINMVLDITRKNVLLLQRYFELKAKLLRVKKLHRVDLYAPIDSKNTRYPFDKIISSIVEIYTKIDPEFGLSVKRILQLNLIDSEVRKNKYNVGLAYFSVPGVESFISLNYAGTLNDVRILAHELGHAVHHHFSSKNNVFQYHPTLPILEIFSCLSEKIILEDIASKTKKNKIVIIESLLNNFYKSVFRQAFIIMFEQKAHEAIAKGATVDELADLYYGLLKEQFGESVILPKYFELEWLTINHLFSHPFYSYSYVFGELISSLLYWQHFEKRKAMVLKIKRIMDLGGSKKPVDILKEVNIDITNKEVWEDSFKIFDTLLREFEDLTLNKV